MKRVKQKPMICDCKQWRNYGRWSGGGIVNRSFSLVLSRFLEDLTHFSLSGDYWWLTGLAQCTRFTRRRSREEVI